MTTEAETVSLTVIETLSEEAPSYLVSELLGEWDISAGDSSSASSSSMPVTNRFRA